MLLEQYNQRLRAAGAVDFDDLLALPLDLFRKRPDVLDRVQRRYDHVLIDEFQDTNRIQYELARRWPCRSATSTWWATTTSRFTAGAAPITATCSPFSRISKARRSIGWNRITAQRSRSSTSPTT